jgi:alpha-L-fucosidase 2
VSVADSHSLWYAEPADRWTEALPLGNGVLGAMVHGDPLVELIQLNDGRAWSGSPASETAEPQIEPKVAEEAVAAARAAIDRHDYEAADNALKKLQHRYSQTYLPFGDLQIAFEPEGPGRISNYRRELDLRTATHEVRYHLDGSPVTQRSFVSAAHGVLVVTLHSTVPISVRLTVTSQLRILGEEADERGARLLLKMPADVTPSHDEFDDPIHYSDNDALSEQGALVMRVAHDGTASGHSHDVFLRDIRRATIYIATETNFVAVAEPPVGSAADAAARALYRAQGAVLAGADAIHAIHVRDHSELYGRASADTGNTPDIPTGERLVRANADPRGTLRADPALAGLLFNYGRYLLISSSRAAGVAANLQGIWNDQLQPPWSSNYTTNINLQMNYWMAETTNLPECLPPLFDLIEGLVKTGTRTASRLYGSPGWVAHHNTDVWAYSQPVGLGSHDPKWAFWPLAGAWLVRHLWERILHGADDSFARDRAYGPIRSAAEFFLSWLVEQPDGSLGTSPSTSPENQFRDGNGVVGSVARSSAFDLVVIADLFDMLIALSRLLGREDDPVAVAAAHARTRIPDPTVGADGTVQEWADDFEFPDPHHRHIAHLYFVYPGDRSLTPELKAAATLSLDARGDESTGWSLAWKLAMRARLEDAESVSRLIALMLRDMSIDRGPWIGGMYPNLFAAHPPFQIDGNLGFVAGLAECVVQSHRGSIDLLFAVPLELAEGSVRGVIARPGVEVSVEWETDAEGRIALHRVTLRSRDGRGLGVHLVRYRNHEMEVLLDRDSEVELSAADFLSVERTA